MNISARIQNSHGYHKVTLTTNKYSHSLTIPPKATGFGSKATGGELLLLALATCYGNDIYREADRRGITVENVEVEVTAELSADGQPLRNVAYRAKVAAQASAEEIHELMQHTDQVAEIHNTLRSGTPVTLSNVEAVTV
jgi:uncharacterized OsmC-like protein